MLKCSRAGHYSYTKPMRRFVRSQGKGILDHKVVISEGHRWGLAPLKSTAAKILKSSALIFTTFVASRALSKLEGILCPATDYAPRGLVQLTEPS